jgi:hypothetical protein
MRGNSYRAPNGDVRNSSEMFQNERSYRILVYALLVTIFVFDRAFLTSPSLRRITNGDAW